INAGKRTIWASSNAAIKVDLLRLLSLTVKKTDFSEKVVAEPTKSQVINTPTSTITIKTGIHRFPLFFFFFIF
ncbi:hypothetical protein ABTA72_19630, partial [Acinetobacter baumannii]